MRCRKSSTAGCLGNTQECFRIVHPFHPFRGAEYQLVTRKLTWGEDRAFYYDSAGALKSFLCNVTDLITQDEFNRISSGRSAFRLDDLMELRRLLDQIGQGERPQDV
jgi:YD repeat-containing protein